MRLAFFIPRAPAEKPTKQLLGAKSRSDISYNLIIFATDN